MYFSITIFHCLWRIPLAGGPVNKDSEAGLIKKHIFEFDGALSALSV